MQPFQSFALGGVAKFVFVQTLGILLLAAPTTWLVTSLLCNHLAYAQIHDSQAIVKFVTFLVCVETLAFCPVMIAPISASLGRLERAQARLEALADTDSLTGLLNRRGLEKAATGLIARATAQGATVAALLCDLDHFKRVNDIHGHDLGDETLRVIGRLMRERFAGENAVAGRFGGEEFLMVSSAAHPRAAEDAAEALRAAVAACEIAPARPSLRCTLSVGVASAAAPCDLGALVSRADAALYAAKSAGRNRVAA